MDRNVYNNYNNLSYGNLIYPLPANLKSCLRNLEKVKKKITNEKYALLFNKTCINEGLHPKYTRCGKSNALV